MHPDVMRVRRGFMDGTGAPGVEQAQRVVFSAEATGSGGQARPAGSTGGGRENGDSPQLQESPLSI